MIFKKILILLLLHAAFPLDAHNRSESYSKFLFTSLPNGAEIKVSGTIKRSIFESLQVEIKFQSYDNFITYLGSSIDLGSECKLRQPVEFTENNSLGVLKFYWAFECSQMPPSVSVPLFQDFGLTHTHIARGQIDGETIPEFMFASKTDLWQINSLSSPDTNQSSY